MDIVFVIPYFYGAWAYGGQPRSAYEMARGLVARGHTVRVLTTDSGGKQRLEPGLDGIRNVEGIRIRYYRNLSNTLAFRHRVFLPSGFFGDIARQLTGADIVHIHELRSFLSVSAAVAAARRSIPYVLSPHGGLQHLGKKGLKSIFDFVWGRRILRSAAGLLAISPVEEADAREFGVPCPIFQVPNGVAIPTSLPDRGAIRRKYRLQSGKVILFLGRLHRVKGADILVEAFGSICQSWKELDVHLLLAGPDDGQEHELRRLVRRLSIDGRVTFTGYLDQTEKLQALVDSDLVVVPSRSEVFAITAIEALLCKRPVLLSSACGLYPAPSEADGVRTFDYNSIEDLTRQLQTTLSDSQLLEAANRGRLFAMREFSRETVAERLEKLYRAVGEANG